MKRVPLEEIVPGMTLAQQVLRDDGVLVAPKGAEITEGLLRILNRMGVESVPVDIGETESEDERKARLQKETEEIELRFSRVKADPILGELKKALLTRLAEGD